MARTAVISLTPALAESFASGLMQLCHLDQDSTIGPDVDVHACAPHDLKKTTICHFPPGNSANAHTLCVGKSAVLAHLDHGDYLGTCKQETPCTPLSGGMNGGGPNRVDNQPGTGGAQVGSDASGGSGGTAGGSGGAPGDLTQAFRRGRT